MPLIYRTVRRSIAAAMLVLAAASLVLPPAVAQNTNGHPAIRTRPTIDGPRLLDWPRDFGMEAPDLTEPTANRLFDLHGMVGGPDAFDLVLSTSGNYHMALAEYWYDTFLPAHPDIERWFYTTSPPISVEQTQHRRVTFGNLRLHTRPHVAVGPRPVMEQLEQAGVTTGPPVPILRNRGNVLLVRKGNPKDITTIWDLARPDVVLVTSNPDTEPGSFGNYATTLYQIARQDPNPPDTTSAGALFDAVFNSDQPGKWLAGARIHHREVPWSLIHGRADAAIIFHHLGRYLARQFPDKLEVVPLGGTLDAPDPLPGNRVATLYAVSIQDNLNDQQRAHQQALIDGLQSDAFRSVLARHFLDTP